MVRKMWEMLLSGSYTRNQILNIANDEWGFRTREFKRMGKNKLTRFALYNIFTNPFYKGLYYFEGNEYKLNHPKMVSEDEM